MGMGKLCDSVDIQMWQFDLGHPADEICSQLQELQDSCLPPFAVYIETDTAPFSRHPSLLVAGGLATKKQHPERISEYGIHHVRCALIAYTNSDAIWLLPTPHCEPKASAYMYPRSSPRRTDTTPETNQHVAGTANATPLENTRTN